MRSFAVARYTLSVLVRHQLVGLALAAGIGLIGMSFLMTYLTPGTERRTFFNLAYLSLEFLAVAVPVLGGIVLQIIEFEQRTVWLVLSRPVSRGCYVLGRFGGLCAASWLILAVMGAALCGLTAACGALPEPFLAPVFGAAMLEAALISALACVFTLLTTSYLTALVLTAGLILAGYFSVVLPLVAQKFSIAGAETAAKGLYWILPHLFQYSVRDFTAPAEGWYLTLLALYSAAYGGILLALTWALFRSREV